MRIIAIALLSALIILDICHTANARRSKRTEIELNSDVDVSKYIKKKGTDMMIFNCKKVVMVQWLHSVLPYVDLQCEVLGDVSDVKWYFNGTLIDTAGTSGKAFSLSQPHYRKRTFYNKWFDYKLRLLHVTEENNGPYEIRLRSPEGNTDEGNIMLEVMTEYRDDKWFKWMNRVNKDRSNKKSTKRSISKMAKQRKRELMRQIRRRAKDNRKNDLFIFEGQ